MIKLTASNQGNRNASDGIALAQTMEAGMSEIEGMLQKIRTLAVQASNGTNTAQDKAALSKEASSLANEISRIAQKTTYGGKTILNGQKADESTIFSKADNANVGKAGTVTLQVGSNKGDTISFTVDNMQFSVIGTRADANFADKVGAAADNKLMNIDKGVITFQFSVADPSEAIKLMDDMIAQTDSARAGLGAMQNRLESSIRNQSNVAANEADARSRIRDADFAEESANLTQQNIIQQAAASMLMQANTRPQLGLSLLG